jgi:hypothetical protein
MALARKGCRHVHGYRGLASAAFFVSDNDDMRHAEILVLAFIRRLYDVAKARKSAASRIFSVFGLCGFPSMPRR